MVWALEGVEVRDAVAEAAGVAEPANDAAVAWPEAIGQNIVPKDYESNFSFSETFGTF